MSTYGTGRYGGGTYGLLAPPAPRDQRPVVERIRGLRDSGRIDLTVEAVGRTVALREPASGTAVIAHALRLTDAGRAALTLDATGRVIEAFNEGTRDAEALYLLGAIDELVFLALVDDAWRTTSGDQVAGRRSERGEKRK